jgi:hypothetical protein
MAKVTKKLRTPCPAKGETFAVYNKPVTADLSLFDVPNAARLCIDKLKKRGIGRVSLKGIFVNNGQFQVVIRYFPALDSLNAEIIERGVHLQTGLYLRYHLPVNDDCEIVWVKQTGIWNQQRQRRSNLGLNSKKGDVC